MSLLLLAADSPAVGSVEWFLEIVARYGLSLGVALLVLAAGFPVTRWFTNGLITRWTKAGLDPSLHYFLRGLILWVLRAGLLLVVAAKAGLEVTAFVAMLGGFAFALGLALQGHLSNIAGGILILVLRPFRAGDFIEAQGYTGTVTEIHGFNTLVRTTDNRIVILPNGPLSNGNIVNFTREKIRRVDLTVGIAYGADVAKAREAVLGVIAAHATVLADPPPEVHVGALADSSVNLVIRAWAPTPAYWPVFFALTEGVKKAFDAAGIEIPFPQRVVHMVPAPGK